MEKIIHPSAHRSHACRLALGSLLLLASLLLTGCLGTRPASKTDTSSSTAVYEPATEGTAIEPPRPLTDFTFTNQDGEPMSLSDLRGKPVLLYFGYTFCPDVCPTTLADMVRIKRQLGEQADQVQYVMVSLDSDRDSPQVLKTYLANFDEAFIGMQGEPRILRKIGSEYGLYFKKQEIAATSAAYLMDHSTALYLIDEQGRLRMIYGYGIPASVVSSDVQTYLETGTFAASQP
jgi:protein SCO1/2